MYTLSTVSSLKHLKGSAFFQKHQMKIFKNVFFLNHTQPPPPKHGGVRGGSIQFMKFDMTISNCKTLRCTFQLQINREMYNKCIKHVFLIQWSYLKCSAQPQSFFCWRIQHISRFKSRFAGGNKFFLFIRKVELFSSILFYIC